MEPLTVLVAALSQATGPMQSAPPDVRTLFEVLLRKLRPFTTPDEMIAARLWYGRLDAQKVYRAVLALITANNYHPASGPDGILVHNSEIAGHLRRSYSRSEFDQLLALCYEHGVFKLEVNPLTGLVRTSICPENWEMHARQWVEDTLRVLALQRTTHPQEARLAVLTLARFYCLPNEQEDIARTVQDRNYYIEVGPDIERWLRQGVAHVFVPGTPEDPFALGRDSGWFNHKRLGSHGLALAQFCLEVICVALSLTENSVREEAALADAIASLAAYLGSLNTDPHTGEPDYKAPSAGNWEELPFPDGLTSDTEAMRRGFEALHYLLSDHELGKNLLIERFRRLLRQHKYNAWLNQSTLEKLIAVGARKVTVRLLSGPHPMEHPTRPADSSLFFISTSTIRLGDNVWEDAVLHFGVLDYAVAILLRDCGMIRYAPFILPLQRGGTIPGRDSYLALNFWLPHELQCWIADVEVRSTTASGGSTDTSTEQGFVDRQKFMPEGTEAQWCWTSEAANGYARKTSLLLAEVIRRGGMINNTERRMINHGVAQAHNLVNRSFARITPGSESPVCKSNGMPCPPWSVPEAYEFVSNTHGGFALLPGVNTPLAWAQLSLFEAAQSFRELLVLLEQVRQIDPTLG